MAPSQLVVGGKCVVLSFQVFCNMFIPDACRIEDFSALYMIRRTKEGSHFLTVKSGSERLMTDNDHRWSDTHLDL